VRKRDRQATCIHQDDQVLSEESTHSQASDKSWRPARVLGERVLLVAVDGVLGDSGEEMIQGG
jgi:hypothetical protein